MAQFKILEAQRVVEEAIGFLRELAEGEVGLQDALDFVTAFFPEGPEKRETIRTLIDERANGGALHPDLAVQIEMDARSLIMRRLQDDQLSRLASTRIVREDAGSDSWRLVADDLLIANFGQGTDRAFGYCVGRPGSGKTGVAILAVEQALRRGWEVISNIHLKGRPPAGYHYESTLAGLLRAAATRRLEDTPFLLAADEGGLWWLRSQAMRAESQGMEKVARIIGKLGASTLFIEQREAGVPRTVVDFARSAFYCRRPGLLRVEHRGPVHYRRTVRDVPRPSLPYDAKDISYMVFDLDVDALFRKVGTKEGGSRDQAEAILAYLDGEREIDKEAKRWAARTMYATGKLTHQDIADRLGVARTTITSWLKEEGGQ